MKTFDWEQYIKNYPDLEKLNTLEKAKNHYLRYGIHENRVDYINFYSIFYKNGIIYVIQPIYKNVDMYFKLFDTIGYEIKLTDQVIKDQWEPIIISMFKIEKNRTTIDVILKFGSTKIKKSLEHIVSTKDKFLTLTTLFKDDYEILPLFYNYYKKQGVEHFYLYYNGKLNRTLKKLCDKPDITLIEWNFVYLSENAYASPHIAQTGQIHDAIYNYGKDGCQYMIFCDFDEYLFCQKSEKGLQGKPTQSQSDCFSIKEYILENNGKDTFAFKQILAQSPLTDTFPTTINISELPFEYLTFEESKITQPSAKCIHNMDTIKTASIHYSDLLSLPDTSNYFYHFYNWSQPNRVKDLTFVTRDTQMPS
jgi:hypothetical protein